MNILALDEYNIDRYGEFVPEDIAQNLERYFFHGLIAVTDEGPVGGMMWKVTELAEHKDMEKESSIIWLRIDDPNAAKPLFEFYKLSIDCEEVVRSSYTLPARNFEAGKEALLAAGFTLELAEGNLLRTTLSEISALPVFKSIKPQGDIQPLSELSDSAFNVAIRRFANHGCRGTYEDLEYLPRKYFDNYVSCYCQMDDMINGILLFHENLSGSLQIVLMGAIGDEAQRIIPQMLSHAIISAKPLYKPGTQVCINRHNYMSLALSERLFPCGFGAPVYTGSRQEV